MVGMNAPLTTLFARAEIHAAPTQLAQALEPTQPGTPALNEAALAAHFARFEAGIVGRDLHITTPYGTKRVVYADWTASGRAYGPLEDRLREQVAPFIANTHTETSATGHTMTAAYHEARQLIKAHVNARPEDVLLGVGTGSTGAINKLQRLLGLRLPSNFIGQAQVAPEQRPLVLVTHMEHHSNHTSWLECEVDVEVIPATAEGLVDVAAIPALLARYADRPMKIAAITACSNVTGIATPCHDIAALMHRAGGLCFVDFACSAPYVAIDMHPAEPERALDAIYFSPHKFLGGPGSSGVLVFNPRLYSAPVPDQPGGGTVRWTNPWQQHRYIDDIETREDGGTPGFLQLMRAAMAVKLKEAMGQDAIAAREAQIVRTVFAELATAPDVVMLAAQHRHRLPVFSFYIPGLHYNLVVRLLNDRFGIQARGGCSCAGTYGHYLLNVGPAQSQDITAAIDEGDLSDKPGWVRVSFHPTTPEADVTFVCDAIRAVAEHGAYWAADYRPRPQSNDYEPLSGRTPGIDPVQTQVARWFENWRP
jgi:selenocysteine lyase/cysteine desulfurase